jgi:hypothetical protein
MSNIETPNDFENELRRALRRQEPPSGFTDRVMARIPNRRPQPIWHRQWLAAADATAVRAAACIAVIGSGAWEQHRRQVEGERAKQELIYALTVASESLQTTKHILTR